MTRVTLYRSNGHYKGFEFDGHADYDAFGYDIVCAATSILSQTCVNALIGLVKLDIMLTADEDSGYLNVKLPIGLTVQQFMQSDLLIEAMKMGLEGIADMYPEHVTVETRGV